jgi:hypothetical protein
VSFHVSPAVRVRGVPVKIGLTSAWGGSVWPETGLRAHTRVPHLGAQRPLQGVGWPRCEAERSWKCPGRRQADCPRAPYSNSTFCTGSAAGRNLISGAGAYRR